MRPHVWGGLNQYTERKKYTPYPCVCCLHCK
jgi:hypothetical protein